MLRSYADDMALMDWLQNKIWPFEAKMGAKDIYWGAMLGIAEMLKGGVIMDVVNPEQAKIAEEEAAAAAGNTGGQKHAR